MNCEALPNGATVSADDSVYAPDALHKLRLRDGDNAFATPNPVAVNAMMLPNAKGSDTGAKLADYSATADRLELPDPITSVMPPPTISGGSP